VARFFTNKAEHDQTQRARIKHARASAAKSTAAKTAAKRPATITAGWAATSVAVPVVVFVIEHRVFPFRYVSHATYLCSDISFIKKRNIVLAIYLWCIVAGALKHI
jgi:hypothetical protein